METRAARGRLQESAGSDGNNNPGCSPNPFVELRQSSSHRTSSPSHTHTLSLSLFHRYWSAFRALPSQHRSFRPLSHRPTRHVDHLRPCSATFTRSSARTSFASPAVLSNGVIPASTTVSRLSILTACSRTQDGACHCSVLALNCTKESPLEHCSKLRSEPPALGTFSTSRVSSSSNDITQPEIVTDGPRQ